MAERLNDCEAVIPVLLLKKAGAKLDRSKGGVERRSDYEGGKASVLLIPVLLIQQTVG